MRRTKGPTNRLVAFVLIFFFICFERHRFCDCFVQLSMETMSRQLIWCVRLIWICFTSSFGNLVCVPNACLCAFLSFVFSFAGEQISFSMAHYIILGQNREYALEKERKKGINTNNNNNTRFRFCSNGCHFFRSLSLFLCLLSCIWMYFVL